MNAEMEDRRKEWRNGQRRDVLLDYEVRAAQNTWTAEQLAYLFTYCTPRHLFSFEFLKDP